MLLSLKELICRSNSLYRILRNYRRKGMEICSAAAEDLKILKGINTLILQMKKHLSGHLNHLKSDCRMHLSKRAYLGRAPHCKLPLILGHLAPETLPTAPGPPLPCSPPLSTSPPWPGGEARCGPSRAAPMPGAARAPPHFAQSRFFLLSLFTRHRVKRRRRQRRGRGRRRRV